MYSLPWNSWCENIDSNLPYAHPCPTFFLISAKNHSAPPTLQTKKLHPYYYHYAVIIVFS